MTKSAFILCSGALIGAGLGCGDDPSGDDGLAGALTEGLSSTGDDEPGDEDSENGASSGADGSDGASGDDGASEDAPQPDPNHKFDILALPDTSHDCGESEGELEFSYLWAANSQEGTISKIDTKTVTELGRYLVRPDGSGSPSRTSVSLSGHVAVASRHGGVTKIYADPALCEDDNETPGVQTSDGPEYLAWGEEECVAWHRPMNYLSQRPVAWGPGVFDPTSCTWEDEELWTSGTNQDGLIDIYVLDGEDGSTLEMISVPTGGAGLSNDFNGDYYGIYGGAVDGDGNFWGSQLGSNARLIRVDRSDMSWETWPAPANAWWYGMTVDADGMVWLCSEMVGRFDPATETWETAYAGGAAGCMADAGEDGLLWMADGVGVVGVDRDTLQIEKQWDTGGSYGISIDFEGYVWAVAFGNEAHKLDPETGEVWTYAGLVGAYTYSDMTGYALRKVGSPSG